jgi:hypothetical protein
VEDPAAGATWHERKNCVRVAFAILYGSISKLAGIFPISRAIQICILRLFARRILAREDMFPKGVAENSAEE